MILDKTSNYWQAKTLLVAVCSSNQTRRQVWYCVSWQAGNIISQEHTGWKIWDTTFLQNTGISLPNYTVSHLKQLILNTCIYFLIEDSLILQMSEVFIFVWITK